MWKNQISRDLNNKDEHKIGSPNNDQKRFNGFKSMKRVRFNSLDREII